jgi:uncharacterized protein (TIGR03083 family)
MDNESISQAELLERVEVGWAALQAFIARLSPDQLTQPTDAAGWTVKDHLMHLALWEESTLILVSKESRQAHFAVDDAVWNAGFDAINAALQQRYRDLPLDEVLAALESVHQRTLTKLASLSDDDLSRPYRAYQPGSEWDEPVIDWIVGNTYEHYEEHLPWMQAILDGESSM